MLPWLSCFSFDATPAVVTDTFIDLTADLGATSGNQREEKAHANGFQTHGASLIEAVQASTDRGVVSNEVSMRKHLIKFPSQLQKPASSVEWIQWKEGQETSQTAVVRTTTARPPAVQVDLSGS